jgi:hypothetical protein
VGTQFGEEALRLVQVLGHVRRLDVVGKQHLPRRTNTTGGPVRPGTGSTLTVSLLVGTRSARIPGNNVSMLLLRIRAPQKLAEIVVVSLKALQ